MVSVVTREKVTSRLPFLLATRAVSADPHEGQAGGSVDTVYGLYLRPPWGGRAEGARGWRTQRPTRGGSGPSGEDWAPLCFLLEP